MYLLTIINIKGKNVIRRYFLFLVVVLCLVLAGCSGSKNGNGLDDVVDNVKLTVEVWDAMSGKTEDALTGTRVMAEI